MDFKLNVKHGRIYIDKNKKSKYYFMCHAYCSICGTECIFSIYNSLNRDQLPLETDSYISVEFERKSDHLDHKKLEKNQKNQVRGEERERLKKEFKESGQTAQDFQ
jgi:hypothetical protein